MKIYISGFFLGIAYFPKKHQGFTFLQNNLLLYTTIFMNLDMYKHVARTYVEKLHRVDDARHIWDFPDFSRSYVFGACARIIIKRLGFYLFKQKINKKKETKSSDGFFFNINPVVFIFFILLKIYFDPKSVHAKEHWSVGKFSLGSDDEFTASIKPSHNKITVPKNPRLG